MFSEERKREGEVLILFELILETYFPILLRQKFVQESLKKKKIILSSKIAKKFIKRIEILGNLFTFEGRLFS